MKDTIVLEEQKGLWIEEQLLRQADLGERLRVVVEKGEIRILPAVAISSQLPYDTPADEAQLILKQVHEEAVALYGGQAPPDDQPYFGDMTWQEYRALSEKERQALWDRLYAEFDVNIDDVEEHNVRPDALVAG